MTRGLPLALVGNTAVAAAGGGLFAWLNVPLAWMLGALAFSALSVNLIGPVADTGKARRLGQLVLGTATASVLTPEILRHMLALLPIMIVSAMVANLVALLMVRPFAAVSGTDRVTATLSVLPAGLAEMAGLAVEQGGQPDVVALSHSIRVALIVVVVPMILGAGRGSVGTPDAVLPDWTLFACFGIALGLGILARHLGMLNPWIVVPMMVGAVFVLMGYQVAPMPPQLIIVAQVLIGSSLGMRLQLKTFKRLPRVFVAALFSTIALTLVMMLGMVPALSSGLSLDTVTLVLAVAPGGLGEMVAAAKALGGAIPLVVGFQFIRSLLTNLSAPILIRLGNIDHA